jgi:hypothetical protein
MTLIEPAQLKPGDFFDYNGIILMLERIDNCKLQKYICKFADDMISNSWGLTAFPVYLLNQEEVEQIKARSI